MDSKQQYTHPSLLLVNEIEILFTQIRLMEALCQAGPDNSSEPSDKGS